MCDTPIARTTRYITRDVRATLNGMQPHFEAETNKLLNEDVAPQPETAGITPMTIPRRKVAQGRKSPELTSHERNSISHPEILHDFSKAFSFVRTQHDQASMPLVLKQHIYLCMYVCTREVPSLTGSSSHEELNRTEGIPFFGEKPATPTAG